MSKKASELQITIQPVQSTTSRRGASIRVQGLKGKLERCVIYLCQRLAASQYFSALTTILTLYALFGDDLRLLFTDRPADVVFDGVTLGCMFVFGTEIIVCSIGQAGYMFGFFFFLDILSTLTLVLDITYVGEWLFGDSISHNSDAQDSSGGGDQGSDSAEAARAARMSRAGTKAGRVVRLIRLMRLIRLVKLVRKSKDNDTKAFRDNAPGMHNEWDDYEDTGVQVNESAVSKKLSEMTTRRVVILVLSILLILPFFEAGMYKDNLQTSGQYGIDGLYRRFRDDMTKFDPAAGHLQEQLYVTSTDRENYVNDFLLTIYFHNWFCGDIPDDKDHSPQSSFGKLFFLGGSPTDAAEAKYFLPGSANSSSVDWNEAWSGKNWALYLCDLSVQAQAKLRTPWPDTNRCLNGKIRGVSIIEGQDSRVKCPEDLRYQERIVVSPMVMSKAESNKFVFIFVFDRRAGSQMEAALNSAQTIFICMLLGLGAMTFSKDANKLVLAPIERMITKLDKIRANPIAAMTLGEDMANQEQMEELRLQSLRYPKKMKKGTTADLVVSAMKPTAIKQRLRALKERLCYKLTCGRMDSRVADTEPMETIVLEKTMIKIGSLLALGFGEAGGEIIASNMESNELSGSLNAMIPGKKVDAIFFFCSVRNFTDATEVLENHVMVFVNRIAGIVHSAVNEFFGSPSQNVGGTFLLVWRLSGHEESKQCRLADCATVSFMNIIAHICKSPLLAEYRSQPALVKRLPNYRVRMGFGLHTGWAIEGAIGSDFKIDASYIGPHVHMAARLQGFTHVYGSSVIISEQLVKLMSAPIAALCRLIDCVTFHDWDPFRLYTIDLDDLALDVEIQNRNLCTYTGLFAAQRDQFKQRLQRQRKRIERWSNEFNMGTYVQEESDIKKMREKYSEEFFKMFSAAYKSYEEGNWPEAEEGLALTRFLNGSEDGPSAALLRFIRTFKGEAPQEWRGYRIYDDL